MNVGFDPHSFVRECRPNGFLSRMPTIILNIHVRLEMPFSPLTMRASDEAFFLDHVGVPLHVLVRYLEKETVLLNPRRW